MKAKFLLAAVLVLTLSVGSAFAGTTKAEAFKTEKVNAKGDQRQGKHHRHHLKFHRRHHMIKHK
jgi:hypothetical protein